MNKETLYFLDPQNSTFYFYIYISGFARSPPSHDSHPLPRKGTETFSS